MAIRLPRRLPRLRRARFYAVLITIVLVVLFGSRRTQSPMPTMPLFTREEGMRFFSAMQFRREDTPAPVFFSPPTVPSRWRRPPSPNPYKQPGYFNVSQARDMDNLWIPFHSMVPRPPKLGEMMLKGPAEAGKEMGWLMNRTVLILGDSIDRFHENQFCYWMGQDIKEYGLEHPLYPAYAYERERHAVPFVNYTHPWGRPRVCNVPAWNFTMIYHWLSTSEEESAIRVGDGWSLGGYFQLNDQYSPPSLVEDRIQTITGPFLKNIKRTPDLIEFSTSAWDLAWQRDKDYGPAYWRSLQQYPDNVTRAENEGKAAMRTPLSFDFLQWWRRRTLHTFGVIRQTFGPIAPIMYRIMHHQEHTNEHPSRTAQLNHAAKSIPGLEIDNWAELIQGQEMLMDWIHPDRGPAWLWLDMFLFRLWEAVTDAEGGLYYSMPTEDL